METVAETSATVSRLNPETIRPVPEIFRGIYTHAVETSGLVRLIFISGQIGVRPDGSTAGTFLEQCHQAMTNVETLLATAGMAMSDVLRVVYYVTDPGDLSDLRQLRQTRWASDHPPAVTTLVVAALANPDLLVEIEVTAGR